MTAATENAEPTGPVSRDGTRERNRAADRFAALGLARDPFPDIDLHLDCYLDSARERYLEALANLRGLGRPLVLVTGPEGVGRTSFFHALLRRLPDDVPVVRVTAGVFLSARNLLQAVARAMGLATDPDEERAVLRERLEQEIFELGRSQVFCAVVVDDADELEAEALEELISLAELSLAAGGVRVVLFGGGGLRRVLVDVAGEEQIDFLAFDVALDAFSINDLRTYLQFRLGRAGHRGASPFSEDDIAQIYHQSGGLPRSANAVARALLLARRPRWPGLAFTAAGGLTPERIGVAGAGVLLLALVAWLLWPSAAEPPQSVTTGPGSAAALDDAWLPVPEATSGAPAEVERSSSPAARSEDGSPGRPAVSGASRDDDAIAPAAAPAQPPPVAAERPVVVVEPPLAAPPAAQRVAPRAAAAEGTRRHPLLDRDASRYVLQVLGTSSRSNGEAWIAAQADAGGFVLVERDREGQPWFVVFYGDYASRSEAINAVPRVAGATGTSPWVRVLAEVKAEMQAD